MFRSRHFATLFAVALSGLSFARPLHAFQTPIVPTGRVCVKKNFNPQAGSFEPTLFSANSAIAVVDTNLYSTSQSGGRNGAGTIFQMSPNGDLKVLHNFVNYNNKDGSLPMSGLVYDSLNHFLWGTTYAGGLGAGTLFRIRPNDTTPDIRYRFRNGSTSNLLPDCPNHRCPYTPRQRADIAAGYPLTAPVITPGGVLYGVTPYSNNQIYGVLYRFDPPYDSTTFHAVCIFDQRLLADPQMKGFVCKAKSGAPSALILAPDGTLYGTTLGGNGTVFRATTSGTGDVTTIHEFELKFGSKPYNLMMASNGRLYGTTANGGDNTGGVMYSMDTFGRAFTILSNFHLGTTIQGFAPVGALTEVDPPNSLVPLLFGSAKGGGRYSRGVLFRMPLNGDSLSLRVLHSFDMYTTGRVPTTPMVLGPRGILYGLTYQGGGHYDANGAWALLDGGVMYSLNPIVLNDSGAHDAGINYGTPAKNDAGRLLSDPIADVTTGANAYEIGVPGHETLNGITVRGHCPNPHIVQFVYRQRLSPQKVAWPGTVTSGSDASVQVRYELTTSMSDIHWHTDVPPIRIGALEQRNAYVDEAKGAAHSSAPSSVTFFDAPNFPGPPYPAAGQDPDPLKSEIWEIWARDFLVCNCEVKREIWWSKVMQGGKESYTHMWIITPVPDALDWINMHLKADGFAPIP